MTRTSFSDFIIETIGTAHFFWVACLLALLLHAPFLDRPPEANHAWRQSHTLSMARNFYEEGMNPLKPRVDNRKMIEGGVTGSHFPAYEFGLASLYLITGEQFWVQRLYSFLLYLWGAWGIYCLVVLLLESTLGARLAFWGYLWSPLLFYHGINALPDVLALPASIWGLYFFLTWWKGRGEAQEKTTAGLHFTLSLVFTTLAGLTKLQYLAIGFFIAPLILLKIKEIRLGTWLSLAVFAFVSLSASLGWYAYALHLIEVSKLAEFGLEMRPVDDLGTGLGILTKNLLSDLPELLLNYAGFVLIIIGIYHYHKEEKQSSSYRWSILVWGIGLLAYHLIELSQMRAHQYYMMPYFPLLLLFVAYGGKALAVRHRWGFIVILLLIQPFLAAFRILPSTWMGDKKNVPQELYEPASRQRLAALVPDNAPCIIGVDESNCIYFYYLKKKGYGISYNTELWQTEPWGELKLAYYIRKGARYLYLDNETVFKDPRTQRYIEKVVGREGGFIVAKLKEVKKMEVWSE